MPYFDSSVESQQEFDSYSDQVGCPKMLTVNGKELGTIAERLKRISAVIFCAVVT